MGKDITYELIVAQEHRHLFKLYLEKIEKMTEKEREIFCEYFKCLLKPLWVIKK